MEDLTLNFCLDECVHLTRNATRFIVTMGTAKGLVRERSVQRLMIVSLGFSVIITPLVFIKFVKRL